MACVSVSKPCARPIAPATSDWAGTRALGGHGPPRRRIGHQAVSHGDEFGGVGGRDLLQYDMRRKCTPLRRELEHMQGLPRGVSGHSAETRDESRFAHGKNPTWVHCLAGWVYYGPGLIGVRRQQSPDFVALPA